jgi:hypothetical protein
MPFTCWLPGKTGEDDDFFIGMQLKEDSILDKKLKIISGTRI